MARKLDTQQLKNFSRIRLQRLRNLRAIGAPPWIIKSEQVAMVLNRAGMRYSSVGQRMSKREDELTKKHVLPTLGKED